MSCLLFTRHLHLVQLLLISLEDVTKRSSDSIAVDVPLIAQVSLNAIEKVQFALQVDTHLRQIVPAGTFSFEMSLNEIANAIEQVECQSLAA